MAEIQMRVPAFVTPRFAVSALFLMNGFLIGNWAPKIPEFAARLSLEESQLGLMIACFAVGSLLTMPLIGLAIARIGAGPVVKFASAICATTLVWITLAPTPAVAAFTLFVFGAFISGMDVAMNALGVDVERRYGSAIMSSLHGFWSLGGLCGALSGGFLIEISGEMGQAIVATTFAVLTVLLVWKRLGNAEHIEEKDKTPIRLPRTITPYLFGLLALSGALPEGAIIDWSALYLRQELATDAFVSAFAFAAFSSTMALIRFFGDPIRQRFGAVTTIRVCAGFAFAGLMISGLAPNPGVAIFGFAVCGIGLANIVPIAFSAAGNFPGVAPGIVLSITTTIGYSGFLAGPAVFGFIAESTGFSAIFIGLGMFMCAALFLSRIAHFADFQERE